MRLTSVTLLRHIAFWTGWVLGGGLLLFTLLGYVSAYLPPRYFWWTGPMASALPWLSLLVVPLALVGLFWGGYSRSWVVAVLSGAVLLLIAIRFGPLLTLSSVSKVASGADPLRVMSFNAPTREADQFEAAEAVVALAQQERSQVIALQEVAMTYADSTERRMGTSTQIIGLISELRYTPELPGYPHRLEQPIVARGPLRNLTRHTFPFPWGVLEPTRVTQVRFPWQDTSVTMINVHLHTVSSRKPWDDPGFTLWNPRTWWRYVQLYREGALRRAAEARRIRELIEQTPGPLLVAGDFNSTPHSWVYRHIAQGLQDTFATAGRGMGFTYPAPFPLVRIDYILASRHWDVVAAHVPEAYARSDHRPVVAHLQLRNSS